MRKNSRDGRSEGGRAERWKGWVLGTEEGFRGYVAHSRSLALSFVLITPLLFFYEIAIVCFPPARATGAGRFLRELLSAVFRSRAGIVLNVLVLVLLVVAVVVLARRGPLRLKLIIPMAAESAGWAAVLVVMALAICRGGAGARLALAAEAGEVAGDIVGSIGAGVYEEILFRLFLTSALYLAGLKLLGEEGPWAALFAAVTGAAVFAACHVLAPGAVPLSEVRGRLYFLFYLTSGLYFGGLYMLRGLGVAVYTHALYDVAVVLGSRLGWPW